MVALAGLTTALTGLTTSAGSLSSIFTSLGSLLSNVGAAIKAAFGAAIDFLKEKFQAIKDFWNDNIQPIFDEFWAYVEPVIVMIWNAFSTVAGGAIDLVVGAFNLLVEGAKLAWEGLTTYMSFIWNGVVMPVIEIFTGLFSGAMALVTGDWKGFIDSAMGLWDDGIMPLIDAFLTPFLFGIDLLGKAWDGLVGLMGAGWEMVMGFFDFEWADLLPTFNWHKIIPFGLADFFTLDNLNRVFDNITAVFKASVDVIKDAINDYIIDTINDMTGYELPIIGESLQDIIGFNDIPHLAKGGITSGPKSGYPAVLHGTEAVVPLSGNRSIPVEMKGSGGGGSNTFNITINPSGITDRTDKRELARSMGNMIQQEISRALGGTTMRGRM